MKIRSRLGLLAAAAGLTATPLVTPGPAWAISDTPTRSMTVRFDPRELNSDKGADHLLSRISGAATKVCDAGGSTLQLIESGSYRVCRHEAIARAVADVNRPTVTAAYNRHFGERERSLRAATGSREPEAALRTVAAVD